MDVNELARVDKLNELISEIEVINYLHNLMQEDTVDGMRIGLDYTQQSAVYFIYERYKDVIARMKEYVNSDFFNQPEGNCLEIG